jgi:hypothetical protein
MRVVPMRIAPVAPARPMPVPPGDGLTSPTATVCAALLLALFFLVFQIASVLQAPPFPDCSFIGGSVKDSCSR